MKSRFLHRILIIAGILLTGMYVTAQPRLRTAEMYIGAHGGVLASMVMWSPTVAGTSRIEQTTLLGPNAGLVFRYSKHKCCGLQVELNYMQRGWREKIEATDLNPQGYYSRRLDYIELPFLMHIYFGKTSSWRGIFNLGPQIGYCVHESSAGVKHATEQEQYKPVDRPFDWGLAGGLGGYYRHEKAGVFQLEARFNYSLGDIFANGKMDYFGQSHAMNLSLNFAYLWQIPQHQHKHQHHKH